MVTTRSARTKADKRKPTATAIAASAAKGGKEGANAAAANNDSKDSNSSDSKSFEYYEFGGPVGALLTTLALPAVVLVLAHWSDVGRIDLAFARRLLFDRDDDESATAASSFSNFFTNFLRNLRNSSVLCPSCGSSNWTLLKNCCGGILAWFLFQVVLERILPGPRVRGAPVKGDPEHRLAYKLNGHLAFWTTLLLLQTGWPYLTELKKSEDGDTFKVLQFGSFPYFERLYDCYAELALAATWWCFALSTYLYLHSFRRCDDERAGGRPDKIVVLADGGNSGRWAYDFFLGRELNPRLFGTFDWKVFCELRPGLLGWLLLNLSCAHCQRSELGYVTGSMMLLLLFQGAYVWDALYQERAILTTMDVTTDGFGFMLVFGDLTWVPFTYSLQARYLVKHDPHLSLRQLLAVVALHMFGYYVFRSANSQKDAFRRDPNDPQVSHLEFLQTKRGTKLLTSGWWGLARKINYTGDWIMGLTWCMLCGFDSVVPYYYAVYFAILLVHRSIRDDHMCQQKYGTDWDTYKELVPYRFVPGIV